MIAESTDERHSLKRSLGPWSLTAMGIGCIIGTGIFVLTGVAAATRAGPALTISFVIAGLAAALAALCYAEVASRIPISGSAYSYAYVTLGEFFAWVIGWDLILEYALGAATVSIGWSGYFGTVVQTVFGRSVPNAWTHSPWDPTPGIMNVPAAVAILVMTALLARGTRESGTVNNIIVVVKISVVLLFIAIGIGHINPANYHLPPGPRTGLGGFMPFGWTGVLGGAAFVFFAYLGFDAVSTSAEESVNPQRDIPFGIIMSLGICTVLYIIVVAVLTGMVPFYELNVANPVAFAVVRNGLPWAGLLISLGALAGLTTVLLVLMFAQSRIIFAMSRDGLIPKIFSSVHRTWRTPIYSTVFFGVLISLLAAFTPIATLASLSVMGTLAAFLMVAIAVPLVRRLDTSRGGFRVPFGPYLVPIVSAIASIGLMFSLKFGSPNILGVPMPWFGLVVWLAIGLTMYAFYGRGKSAIALEEVEAI